MLKEIKIQNFAIIENLLVNFETGLNVLTGETGAGKSIIIDALNLLLGGRADTDSIRTGETTALVEGIFQISNEDTLTMVREIGIESVDGELHIKRQISNSGKNRCFLNDSQITVSTLAKIGNRLVDLLPQCQKLIRATLLTRRQLLQKPEGDESSQLMHLVIQQFLKHLVN